jgi:hypothetical protein
MTQTQETEMNTNENIRNDATEDVIVLGVASMETQGGGLFIGEQYGERQEGIADE